VLLSDGDSLAAYGLDANVIRLPGHSSGSSGILLAGGHFICGDLFINAKGPAFNSIMDDRDSARATMAMLEALAIDTVYPGHGQPFAMASLMST
jgi:hydroxyacylglutathione hydrolase